MKRLACLIVLLGASAWGAPSNPERELEVVRGFFNAGNYAEAFKRAREAMQLLNFTQAQRVEMHRYAGLAAFNLQDAPATSQHFLQLLQLDPDAALDPFAVPPAAIRAFEDVKKKHADELNIARQELQLKAAEARREALEKERRAAEEEEKRRKLERAASELSLKTVEKRSWLVNFVPFGAGQFFQGRTEWGVTFAVSEAVLAGVSIASYFAIESLFEDISYDYSDRLGTPDGKYRVTVRGIPVAKRSAADVWRTLKISTGIAFYVVWALGVVDALLHHTPESVSVGVEPARPRATPSSSAPFEISPVLSPSGAGLRLGLSF